jgi:hypothetical protein
MTDKTDFQTIGELAHSLKRVAVESAILFLVKNWLEDAHRRHAAAAIVAEQSPERQDSSAAQHRACAQQCRELLAFIRTKENE